MSRSIIDGRELDTGENDVVEDCTKCHGSYCVEDGICGYCGEDFNEEPDCDLTDPKCPCEDCTHERTAKGQRRPHSQGGQ